MNIPVITIIGSEGKMGKAFSELFRAHGIEVLEADLHTELKPEQAVSEADIILFSVPISVTLETIEKLAPYAKSGALITDITSIKGPAVAAMQEFAPESCELLGLHPMSGPDGITKMTKTVIVTCPVRKGPWSDWLLKFFEDEQAIVKETTAEEHDRMMSIVQGITHISSIATAMTLKKLEVKVEETMEYSSPIYKLRLEMVGRILSQSPQLYAEIAIENPLTKQSLQAYHEAIALLQQSVEQQDKDQFIQAFSEAADFLGDFKEEAYRKTTELLQRNKDLL